MSKELVAFTIALVVAMTVGIMALTASPVEAGGPCLIKKCSDCPQTIIFPNGLICEFDVCRVQGCPACEYTCHF